MAEDEEVFRVFGRRYLEIITTLDNHEIFKLEQEYGKSLIQKKSMIFSEALEYLELYE